MVGNKIPDFISDFVVDKETGELNYWLTRVRVHVDMLTDDRDVLELPDGKELTLVSLFQQLESAYYKLCVRKVTAQPYYRVYFY